MPVRGRSLARMGLNICCTRCILGRVCRFGAFSFREGGSGVWALPSSSESTSGCVNGIKGVRAALIVSRVNVPLMVSASHGSALGASPLAFLLKAALLRASTMLREVLISSNHWMNHSVRQVAAGGKGVFNLANPLVISASFTAEILSKSPSSQD